MTVCAACGGAGTTPWRVVDEWTYVACHQCGLPRLDPMPTAAQAAAAFDDAYFTGQARAGYADYVADESIHRANGRRHLRRLRRRGVGGGRLLEIGAAAGFLLDEARRTGWDVAGVEPSPLMRAQCRHRHGIELAESLDDLPDGPAFDCVVANQVLEHLPDPVQAVSAIRRLTSGSGTLSIETWDAGALVARVSGRHWQQVSPPSVLWLWNRTQLATLLDRSGFTLDRARTALKLVSVATVTGQIGHTIRIRLPLPYFLGDVIVAHARPTG